MELHWDPENTAMRFVTERLAYASVSNTPDFSLGQYNGHTVGIGLEWLCSRSTNNGHQDL